ncbi:hypothetical protein KAT51_08385 [bacterium]|nr:hypothetical protein [bacterium]
MTKSSEEGIVFDKVFFEAILKKAAQEGFVKHYHPDPTFEWVTHGRTKIALQMALMYKIYYPDSYLTSLKEPIWELYSDQIENKVLQELFEIPGLPMGAFETNPRIAEFIKDCSAIKEFLISNKSRANRCFNPYFNHSYLEYSHEYCSHKLDALLKILNIISDENDTIVSKYEGELVGYDDLKYHLRHWYNVNVSELDYLCSPFNNKMSSLVQAMLGTERESRHLKNLLEFSVEYSVPVLSDDVSVQKSSVKEIKGLERIENAEYSRIALGVFFDEELRPVLPVVNSIKDVLRLRKDHRITDFRNKIFEWTMTLKEGETNLGKIKEEMVEANKKLKTLGKCERVGTWITFLSLPVDAALALSGLPISIVTSIASFGVACTSRLLKRDYDWYLFGIQ